MTTASTTIASSYKVNPEALKCDEFWHITDKSTYFIKDTDDQVRKITVQKELGRGGSKIAYQLEDGRALLTSNGIFNREWGRVVLEETAMARTMEFLGMLTPFAKSVTIAQSEDAMNQGIPAYVCESFESLTEKYHWYILDSKSQSSTWKSQKQYLFDNEEDELVIENWDPVMDSMCTDIAKIFMNNLGCYGDAFNLAFVDTGQQHGKTRYQIRYFGFDFSLKNRPLLINKIMKRELMTSKEALSDANLNLLVFSTADLVFYYGTHKANKHFEPEFVKQFMDRYKEKVVSEMKRLHDEMKTEIGEPIYPLSLPLGFIEHTD